MDFSFHYYGTYCAAREAGFDNDDAWVIAHSAQFVDECSKTLLEDLGKKNVYPTVHTITELGNIESGIKKTLPNEIPLVWVPFHFLPGNLTEDKRCRLNFGNERYMSDTTQIELFRLLCLPYSYTVGMIVDEAKKVCLSGYGSKNKKLIYIGMVMHVLADTFSHEYFVGVPSEAINEVSWMKTLNMLNCDKIYSLSKMVDVVKQNMYAFPPNAFQLGYLGHGRLGTNPDIPNNRYYYSPSWNPHKECFKDNPTAHLCAFQQMTEAMRFIRDQANDQPFPYQKELTHEDYISEYNKTITAILNQDGDEKHQKAAWQKHIIDKYNCNLRAHNVSDLVSDKDFINDFIDNADRHRNLVCDECRKMISSDIKIF